MELKDVYLKRPITTPRGPGYLYGLTTDKTGILTMYDRRDYAPETWLRDFSNGNGKCIYKIEPIEKVEVRENETKPTSKTSTVKIETPIILPEIKAGETWKSTRGKHERFSIMSDVGDDGIVQLLGIDTPGYRRDTEIKSFVRFYYKDDPTGPIA